MGAAYYPTISDCDFDNDGVITQADIQIVIAAGEDGYWAIVGMNLLYLPIWEWIPPPPYNRRYDTNFDDVIDDTDAFYVFALWQKSANIDAIRDALKKDSQGNINYVSLNWGNWQAYLVALDVSDKVLYYGQFGYYSKRLSDFIGIDFLGKDIPGWLSLHLHPSSSTYQCITFATDTMVASYKILGYGCLLEGIAPKGHCYNILWTGGDWTVLSNWVILEPQYGSIVGINAADPLLKGTIYETGRIFFPMDSIVYDFHGASLDVDFDTNTVSYRDTDASLSPGDIEESVPISFDTTLGIPITTIAPTVTTQEDTKVTATTARLNGQISYDGGEACEYRFRYKKSGGAYSYTSWTGAKTTGETFYEDISGLDVNSPYYFNARAKNSIGESAWGSELDFTTLAAIPTVTTQKADQIEENSAMGHGTIVEIGGEDCDWRGAEWGKISGYYNNSAIASGTFSTGAFTRLMTPLTTNTTYYYRAKAHNSAGWGYGNEEVFLTTADITEKLGYETGSGVESLVSRAAFKADNGGGVESLVGRAIVKADSGSGAESFKRRIIAEFASLTASYQRSGKEIGSGLDAAVEIYESEVDKFASDSGSGAEYYYLERLGEVARLIASYNRDETGSALDASGLDFFGSDTGSGVDVILNRALVLAETGGGVELSALTILGIALTGSDSGMGVDTIKAILHKKHKRLRTFTGRDLSDIATRDSVDFAGRELKAPATRESSAFIGRELK